MGAAALRPLIKALKDDDRFVRDVAASYLEKMGGPRAVAAFREALNDDDSDVREFAKQSLNRIAKRSS